MENRIENEDFYQPDLDDFEPELKVRPASLSEKLHAGLCVFADMVPTLFLKFGLVVIAMVAVYFNGYASSQRDFEQDIKAGWYVKNATKWEESERIQAEWKAKGCTPWGSECEKDEVTK